MAQGRHESDSAIHLGMKWNDHFSKSGYNRRHVAQFGVEDRFKQQISMDKWNSFLFQII